MPALRIDAGGVHARQGELDGSDHFNALSPLGFVMLFSLFWKGPWRQPLWTFGLIAFAGYGVCRIALLT